MHAIPCIYYAETRCHKQPAWPLAVRGYGEVECPGDSCRNNRRFVWFNSDRPCPFRRGPAGVRNRPPAQRGKTEPLKANQ
jgi:hypothetical protein